MTTGIDLAPTSLSSIEGISTVGATEGMVLAFDADLNLVPAAAGGHAAVTISNASNSGVQLSLTGQELSGSFASSNVTHNSLSTIQGGASSNYQHFSRYTTVAAAKAATGAAGDIIYCLATDQLYTFVAVSSAVADDDLILTTSSGGTTRWEALAKLTRAHGDNGWINSAGATISATSSTVVRLAMSAVGLFAVKGVRVDIPIGNYDCTISGAAGVKFVGFDDTSLVLKLRNTLWDFDKECPVMIAYWSGTAIVFAPQTEFHTAFRNTVWHLYAHFYQGLQYKSGLTFTGNVQTDNNNNPGADDTVTYLWSTDGILQDEDAACTPGVGQWLQTLGSGLTSTTAAIFGFAYFNGTAVTSAAAMADRSPFLYSGANGTPQWNSAGTLTAAVTGEYIVYHYFGNPMIGGWSVFARPHNAKFTNLTTASAASPSDLTWTNYAELKHLYTAVFRVNTNWDTTHRCKLVSLRSFRLTAGTPAAGTAATDHNALSNRAVDGSHPGLAISLDVANFGGILSSNETSVQTAFDKIDDIRAATATWTGPQTFDGGAAIKGAAVASSASYVGEVIEAYATNTSTSLADTETDVTGLSIELTPGKWLISYSLDLLLNRTAASSSTVCLCRVQIRDSANNAIANTQHSVRTQDVAAGSAVALWTTVALSKFIVITSTTTYKVSINCSDAAANMVVTCYNGDVTGSHTGNDATSYLRAERR